MTELVEAANARGGGTPLRVHALAIGKADALVLELPSGRLAVVDFGHTSLLAYLDALDPARRRRYAFALLTHAHDDHYLCVADFIERHDARVEQYWFGFADAAGIVALEALKRVALARRGKGRLLIQDGTIPALLALEPGVDLRIFAATSYETFRAPATNAMTENNRGIVLLIHYGAAACLLGADVEEARWRRISEQAEAAGLLLRADVVKAPHHGAAPPHGMPDDVWDHVLRDTGTAVIMTVGRSPRHPARATIDRIKGRAVVRCTGRASTCTAIESPTLLTANSPTDLVAQAFPPAPELVPTPSCFGTQIYDLWSTGQVTMSASHMAPPLDACL